jgi:hypothetical protein
MDGYSGWENIEHVKWHVTAGGRRSHELHERSLMDSERGHEELD